MNLEHGVTFGDLAESLRGKFDDLPEVILQEMDTISQLSGRKTREAGFLDAIKFYGEALRKLSEVKDKDYEVVALDQENMEQLRMYEIPFYPLNLSSLPRINY